MKVGWAVLGLLSACAGEWRTTVRADTSAAYAAYVGSHPGTLRAAIAERRAEALGWSEAEAANTSTAYAAYLAAWPSSDHSPEARTRAETLGWEEAIIDSSIAGFSAYVARYPASSHVPEAYVRIEDLWYADAKSEATEASWSRYLVRYPAGHYAGEAGAERERLAWEATFTAATRLAFERYVERFPRGAHVQLAQDWLQATYVATLQPVVALIGTWQPAGQHAALIERVRREFDSGLVSDLKRDFTVRPTKTVDGTGGFPHPHDGYGVEPGVGILVLEYTERQGRKFDPTGTATDITAVVRLYAPNTPNPVYVRELSATTPEKVRGPDLSSLNTEAILDLSGQLRYLDDELAKNRRMP